MPSDVSRTILVNDDGWIMSDPAPVTPEVFREKMVATYRDTPVDALLWSVDGHEVYQYESEVGEVFGEGWDDLDQWGGTDRYENIRGLMRDHGGPLTALAEVCHSEGLKLFPSLRMTTHYETAPGSPGEGRLRGDHPEWLIGHGRELTPDSVEWGIRTGLNYAVPEVRAHQLAIISELFERFDVDGLELDFMRHPGYFKVEEAFSSRHLITDMLTLVRQRKSAASAERGKELRLAIRVPETLADCLRVGLDVPTWIANGLVDVVVVGGGFVSFGARYEEFVEAARGTDTQVYGCIESLRPTAQDEVIRAVADRIWHAGVDGLYLFNYFSRSVEWKQRVLNEIASPENLVRRDKRYQIDHADRVGGPGQLSASFRYGLPAVQLPSTLQPPDSDVGPTLSLTVADDVESAAQDGSLGECTLRLRLERFLPGQRLTISLNGADLTWEAATVSTESWAVTTHDRSKPHREERAGWLRTPWYFEEIAEPATVVEVAVGPPALRQGENEVRVALARDGAGNEPAVLRDVEIDVIFER